VRRCVVCWRSRVLLATTARPASGGCQMSSQIGRPSDTKADLDRQHCSGTDSDRHRSAQAGPGLSRSSLRKDKAGTDSGPLKISAKPDQSQQYAKIDFQIDAYISGSRRPPH
jgi:hypothetical protein